MLEQTLYNELEAELLNDILPYWMERMVDPAGGFYGRMTGDDRLDNTAPRSAILYGRILWTFSAAYRRTGDARHLETATRAKEYILRHFIDPQQGGVYWSVDTRGEVVDGKKQFYAIGFVIYGLSEYHRATGDREALDTAIELYRAIERHAYDPQNNGYEEAAARDWSPLADVRLSDKDANENKTMNTHLHILEAYANLLRAWRDEELLQRTRNLLEIFLERIVDTETGHLGLFFDDEWNCRSGRTWSYGHDIEASWLLLETASTIGDPELEARTLVACRRMADAALEGLRPDGSLNYECHADGTIDREKHWWVQAECVIGQFYLYRYHDRPEALEGAVRTWEYIKNHLIDRQNGEWWWSILPDGTVNRKDDKAGFWKCPYHNGRMCMEIMTRIDRRD